MTAKQSQKKIPRNYSWLKGFVHLKMIILPWAKEQERAGGARAILLPPGNFPKTNNLLGKIMHPHRKLFVFLLFIFG